MTFLTLILQPSTIGGSVEVGARRLKNGAARQNASKSVHLTIVVPYSALGLRKSKLHVETAVGRDLVCKNQRARGGISDGTITSRRAPALRLRSMIMPCERSSGAMRSI